MKSVLVKNQVQKKVKFYKENGISYKMVVKIRYDDQCGNGHNSFAITCIIFEKIGSRFREFAGGCCHDEIAKHFPEIKSLIKWHLCNVDAPMHYIANTLYHISDKDCQGLKAGEFCSFTYDVKTGDNVLFTSKIFYSFRNWLHRDEAKAEAELFCQNIKPELNPEIVQVGSGSPSSGKAREFDAARSSAIWPEATDKELLSSDLKQKLIDRLPALIAEFQKAVTDLGFVY